MINLKDLTTEEEVTRALNQLTALIVGKRFAMETDEYKADPLERISKCHILVVNELQDSAYDSKKIFQAQRKLDSLQSLKILAQLAGETMFEEY
mgnify:FL=1